MTQILYAHKYYLLYYKEYFIDALGIPFLSALNQICIHKNCIGKTMTKQRVDFHEAYSGLLLSFYVVDKGAKKI